MKKINSSYTFWSVWKKFIFLVILLIFTAIFYFVSFSADPFFRLQRHGEFSYTKLIMQTWTDQFIPKADIVLTLKWLIIPAVGFFLWWRKPTKLRLFFAMLILIFYWDWYLSGCFGGQFGYRWTLQEFPQHAHVVPWWIRHLAYCNWWGGR